MSLSELQPKAVWDEFFNVCKIPHGSGNVDAIRAFLKKHAEERGLEAHEYLDSGNLVIIKKADPGHENAPIVCLQAHMDMVCSKRADFPHDFLKDEIKPRIAEVDGKQVVTATGTSLGADDGMGIATALAIVFDKTLKTGKIEVLFTKDEETTMFGVQHIKHENLKAKYLLNLDSEDIGVITIGSAGGFCQTIKINELPKKHCANCKCVSVEIKDCAGGHSGVDAHHYHANAIKQLGRIAEVAMKLGAGLCCLKGGQAHNAIPMDARACFCFENGHHDEFIQKARALGADIIAELKTTDPKMKVEIEQKCCCEGECICVENEHARKIVDFMNIVPSQVLRMSQEVAGLTESSINLGLAHFCAKDQAKNYFLILARSSINSYLPYVKDQIDAIARLGGIFDASAMQDPYGGWKPDPDSKLLKMCRRHYAAGMKVSEADIKVEAIHAGLECAEIMTKFPGQMEAISIGPTIKNPHSDREYCEISTVEPFYEVVKRVVNEIAAM